jgi:integrase
VVPSLDDVHALLSATTRPDLRAMIALAVGARLTTREMESLRWEDVDLAMGTLVVRNGDRRGTLEPSERVVALPRWARDLLELWSRGVP